MVTMLNVSQRANRVPPEASENTNEKSVTEIEGALREFARDVGPIRRDPKDAASHDRLSSEIPLIHAIDVKRSAGRRLYREAMVPEYLKGSARVLRLRRINFGQCLGAYTRTDLKGFTSIGSMNIQNPIACRR